MMDTDKTRALDAALRQIERDFGKGSIMRLGEASAKMNIEVNVGDMVEIIDGSLSSFVGTVKAVDNENQRATVLVEMFGRESEVELGFNQIRISNN